MRPVPIGEHYTYDKKQDAKRFPIDIYRCNSCGAVQTNDDIDPEFLWKDYTYFSGQTEKIVEHFQEFCDDILTSYFVDGPISVLDIGSNDGSLLEQFRKKDCRVQGIDPAKTVVDVANSKNIPTVHSLFNLESSRKCLVENGYDLITAFNVFAHSHEMDSMAEAVGYCLRDNGLFCFEVQYLADIATKNILGTFFHEHMIHYSLNSAEQFLRQYGLKVIDYRRNNIQNGSIIFICCKQSAGARGIKTDLKEKMDGLRKLEMDLGINTDAWSNRFTLKMSNIREEVKELLDKTDFVVAYGAARSGPTLAIQYGFDNRIKEIFDDHTSKVGRYSPYQGLQVRPTAELSAKENPNCLILAYIHSKNIIRHNIKYLKEGGRFIVVWPDYIEITESNYNEYLSGHI